MIVCRGRATIRGGAGLLLAVACIVGPAVAHAAPAPDEDTTQQGGAECEGMNPSASASAQSIELGQSIAIAGECFPAHTTGSVDFFIQGDLESKGNVDVSIGGDGLLYAEFPPHTPGDYSFNVKVDGVSNPINGTFQVEEPADPPTDPPVTEEPTDSPTEDPEDPPTEEQPSDPPEETEEPTDPETPPEEPDPSPTPEPTSTEDPPTAPDEDDSPVSPSPSTSASPDPAPTTSAPSADEDPAPTADAGPTASEQTPSSPVPATPAPATNDFPAAAPEYTAEQREAASLAVLMTSLFAHGVSNGQVGTSPTEAGTPNADGAVGDGSGAGGSAPGNGNTTESGEASDGGGDELAETGTEVAGPAALAALALTGGAGLLWYHRRRNG